MTSSVFNCSVKAESAWGKGNVVWKQQDLGETTWMRAGLRLPSVGSNLFIESVVNLPLLHMVLQHWLKSQALCVLSIQPNPEKLNSGNGCPWRPGMSELERWPGLNFAPLLYWWRAWGLGETRFVESLLSATSTSNTWVYLEGPAQHPSKRLPVWGKRIKAGVNRIDWICENYLCWSSLRLAMVPPASPLWISGPSPFHLPYLLLPICLRLCLHTLSSCPVVLGPRSPGRISSPPHHYPSLLSPQPTLLQCPWQ